MTFSVFSAKAETNSYKPSTAKGSKSIMAHQKKELGRRAPLILAIENSGMCGSVALVSRSHCLNEQSLLSRLTHSKRLLSTVKEIMEESQVDWPDIDAIAITLGPGSFTGLRIGLSTVKGLAMATGIPLIGVSSLDGLACQCQYTSLQVCPVLDARKNEVYTALYRSDDTFHIKRTSDYMVTGPENLSALISEPTLFLGDGLDVYGEIIANLLGENAIFVSPQLCFTRAAAIGNLALAMWDKKEFLHTADAVPVYIRASEAEINLKRKQQIGK